MVTMEKLEQLVDGILAINLDDRPDRWQAFLEEVAPHFDASHIRRLSAVKGIGLDGFGQPPFFRGRHRDKTWAGRAGCALSHREAIAHAAQMGWRSVLILEDDIQFTDRFATIEADLTKALDQQPWDICYLGFTDPIGPFRKVADLAPTHSLYRIYGCNTCHAYLIRDTAYDWLLKQLPTRENIWDWLTRYRAIDRWYARRLTRQFKVLAASPSLINQRPGISDITGRDLASGHITEVLPGISSAMPFGIASGLRRLAFGVSGRYDALRGFIKRRKGF
jgi:GR25 family glycosyltransferase involved in LPS biosynthesis